MQERRTRETQEDAIVKRMHDELAKVQQAMSIESTTRVESEHALIQVMVLTAHNLALQCVCTGAGRYVRQDARGGTK